MLPVLPALRTLLPGGGLRRGSVVAAGPWSLLCLALAAGASAAGAWCAVVGLPQLGVAAAADVGLDPDRMLLVADPGTGWPQVVASLLDGCELVLLRPPDRPSAQVRRRIEATVRRFGGVLVVAGEWDGAQTRLSVTQPGVDGDRNGPRTAACPPGPGGRGRPGRGGAAASPVAVAARARRVGDRRGRDQRRPRTVQAGNPEYRMTLPANTGYRMAPAGDRPPRVLVVWCPDWPDPGAESGARAFEPVVAAVEELCPRVEVLHPGACAIGARGPARYFGGEEALARKIIDAVARCGFACQVGVADGMFAAQLAARAPRVPQARGSGRRRGPRR